MRNRLHGRPRGRKPSGGNAHDRRIQRRKARGTALPMHPEDTLAEEPFSFVTLGDQDVVVYDTHDDTRSSWHRVLDALGALLMFLHLTRRRDTTNNGH